MTAMNNTKSSNRGLTARQIAALKAVASGLSRKEIAANLGVSEATVGIDLRAACRYIQPGLKRLSGKQAEREKLMLQAAALGLIRTDFRLHPRGQLKRRPLSPRGIAVLQGLALGLTLRGSGERIGISARVASGELWRAASELIGLCQKSRVVIGRVLDEAIRRGIIECGPPRIGPPIAPGSTTIAVGRAHYAIVDAEDSDLTGTRWYANIKKRKGLRYAEGRGGPSMHRVVLGRLMGRPLHARELCDHLNGDGLDNRRSNLRVATHEQNLHNHKRSRLNSSGCSGVYWDKSCQRWRAQIGYGGRKRTIGKFRKLDDAIAARRSAEKEFFGAFARHLL